MCCVLSGNAKYFSNMVIFKSSWLNSLIVGGIVCLFILVTSNVECNPNNVSEVKIFVFFLTSVAYIETKRSR